MSIKYGEWDCPICGSHLMRDENAGQNLKQYGINILTNSGQELSSELVEIPSVEGSVKQESYHLSDK